MWKDWKKSNRAFLIEIGVPEAVFEEEMRWYHFLEHGYDPGTEWEYDALSKENLGRLCSFLESIYTRGEFSSFIMELRSHIQK